MPLEEFERNINTILDRLVLLSDHILLITPPPVNEEARRQIAISVSSTILANLCQFTGFVMCIEMYFLPI